jgi:hypothetical protein
MKYGVVLLPVLLALHGAVPVGAAPNAAPAKAKPATQKPAAATDGQPRVIEQRGKFVIKPDTLFCGVKYVVDPKLNFDVQDPGYTGIITPYMVQRLREIGQTEYIGGAIRGNRLDSKLCPDNGKNVIVSGRSITNTAGTPYRLELEARQGPMKSGAFVKVVVARIGKLHPLATAEFDETPQKTPAHQREAEKDWKHRMLMDSLSKDAEDVSNMLVNILFEGKKK